MRDGGKEEGRDRPSPSKRVAQRVVGRGQVSGGVKKGEVRREWCVWRLVCEKGVGKEGGAREDGSCVTRVLVKRVVGGVKRVVADEGQGCA